MCVSLPLPNRKAWSSLLQVPEKDFYAHVNREAFTKIISNLLNNGVKYAESYVHIFWRCRKRMTIIHSVFVRRMME